MTFTYFHCFFFALVFCITAWKKQLSSGTTKSSVQDDGDTMSAPDGGRIPEGELLMQVGESVYQSSKVTIAKLNLANQHMYRSQ